MNERIKTLLNEAEAKIREAEEVADETGDSFHWDGPEYGMGGSYTPNGWNDSGCEWESSDDGGWMSSSQSC